MVSTSTVGSLTTWLVRELSRQQGWGPDGIKIVHLGADTAQIAAMRTGETVGAPLDIATIYRLEDEGVGRMLYRFGDLVQHFHIHVIYASRKVIARDPEGVRRFLAGWFETIAFMRKNKAETVRISAPVMGVSPEIASRAYDELMPMFSDDGKFDPKALETLRAVVRRDEPAADRARHEHALHREVPAVLAAVVTPRVPASRRANAWRSCGFPIRRWSRTRSCRGFWRETSAHRAGAAVVINAAEKR